MKKTDIGAPTGAEKVLQTYGHTPRGYIRTYLNEKMQQIKLTILELLVKRGCFPDRTQVNTGSLPIKNYSFKNYVITVKKRPSKGI